MSEIATFVTVLKLTGHASKDTKIYALIAATTPYKHNPQLYIVLMNSNWCNEAFCMGKGIWIGSWSCETSSHSCSWHFNGDPKNSPQPHTGKQFASPDKK